MYHARDAGVCSTSGRDSCIGFRVCQHLHKPQRRPLHSRLLEGRAQAEWYRQPAARQHKRWQCRAADSQNAVSEEQQLAQDYGALGEKMEELASDVVDKLQGTSIYLVGMMGSGKSTVGRLIGKVLKYPLLDTDALIEESTSRTVAEIFEQEGEESFRELETSVLKELMPFAKCVVATGGGAVIRRSNWGYMQHGVVIWLDGPPELLASRVVGDGIAQRPLVSLLTADHQQEEEQQQQQEAKQAEQAEEYSRTVVRLGTILEERRGKYAFADLQVSLQADQHDKVGLPSAVVAYRVLSALQQKLNATAAEREELKNFVIKESADIPDTLKTHPSPVKKTEE